MDRFYALLLLAFGIALTYYVHTTPGDQLLVSGIGGGLIGLSIAHLIIIPWIEDTFYD